MSGPGGCWGWSNVGRERSIKHTLTRGGLLILLVLVGAGVGARPADAHWADQAVAEVVLTAGEARVSLTFPTGLAAFADSDKSGGLSSDEVAAHRPELERFFLDHLSVRGSDAPTGARAVPGALRVAAAPAAAPARAGTPGTHSALLLIYIWPQPVTALTIRYDLFLPDVPTASCLATIVQGSEVHSIVFTPERREASFLLGRISPASQITSFIVLGVRHILTGYDHLLFLLSLLMVGGAIRPLVKVVTAFTAAHSITLSLAALGLVAFPARWVESAIALSIAYIAAENLWRRTISMRRRWLVTFGFGLVHGLGFASVLRELALPRPALVTSLVGFNLGVELGQLTVVAVAVAALRLAQSWPQEAALRRWVSAGTVAAGLLWFVQRAFLGA